MPLIDLKTNLKDLKFGHDEYKGGNSGQPFIQTKIPANDEPLQTGISNAGPALVGLGAGAAIGAIGGSILGSTGTGAIIGAAVGLGIGIAGANTTTSGFRLPSAGTGGPDFLVRGGTLLPNILVNDTIRLTKYFASTEGVLFAVKQNLLSRIAVRTQASTGLLNEGIYTPISTLIEAVGNSFGLHVNKQGLNPFAGTGPTSENENLYGVRVTSNQIQANNRLVNLYGAKIAYKRSPDSRFIKDNISSDPLTLLSYNGGPNSFLGIGKTNIKLASNPIIKVNPQDDIYNNQINYLTWSYKILAGSLISTGGDINQATAQSTVFQQMIANGLTNRPLELNAVDVQTLEYDLSNPRNIKGYIPSLYQQDFRAYLRDIIKDGPKDVSGNISTTLMSQGPSYYPSENKTLETRTSLGDPGNAFNKNLWSYTNGDPNVKIYSYKGVLQPGGGKGAASINSCDAINTSGIDESHAPTDPPLYKDLVDFRIGIINNDTPGGNRSQMYFRAFLDNISDSYTSNWDATKYIGRGENFYTYSGFDRKVSLSWTVAAQSKIELMQMYRKLNYLASVCAPNYSEEGYMRGNIIELTIGGYFYQQPGIITGFSYEMNEENDSWEIAIDDEGNEDTSVKQLPHIIRVRGFNFTPIHNFVPSLQSINTNGEGIREYGNQRYIALENSRGTNWNVSNYPE